MRLKSDLRGAQQRAITRLYEWDAVQAVMPMGSGKTASAMTAIRELIDDGVIRCALVLAPKRVAQLVWTKEHHLWEHLDSLRICLVDGGPDERLRKLLREDADIYVVGVDNTQWLVEELKQMQPKFKLFDLLCIDEISRFGNPRSKRGRALQKIADRFKIKWGLTGTPRARGYENQFRPMQLLTNEKAFKRSFDVWRTLHFMKVDVDGNPSEYGHAYEVRPEHEPAIRDTIARYSFTVGPEDLPDLPPIVPVFHWIDLPTRAMIAYKRMERDLLYRKVDGKNVLAANAAVASGKLVQMANGFIYDEAGEVEHVHTEKADTLVDLVEGLGGENCAIIYEFREDLRLLKELWPGMPYFGAGVSDAAALDLEAAWNRGAVPVLGLHPASGGHGLNLQYGGAQVLLYSMPWSPEFYDQTLKRFHRPGQAKRVFAHHLLARNTVDEVKYNRVVKRMTEQEAFRNYLEKI